MIHLVYNIIYPLRNLFHLCAFVILYLLLSNIHGLAPEFEIFPKFFWSEILQLAFHQMAKNRLDLEKHTVKKVW